MGAYDVRDFWYDLEHVDSGYPMLHLDFCGNC